MDVVFICDAICQDKVPLRAAVAQLHRPVQSDTGDQMLREMFLLFIFSDAANEFPKGTRECLS